MVNGRKRLITVLFGLALTAAVGFVPSTPAQAAPSIDDVQASVDHLYHEAEQASENYNNAKLELNDLNRDLKSLRADEARQESRMQLVQSQVQDSVVRQYEGQGLNAVGQVVVSKDPRAFLAQLSTMSAFNDLQSQMFSDYTTQLKALDIRREATSQRSDQVAATKKKLAADKATIDGKLAEAKALLGKLQADQRAALASRSAVRTPVAAAPVSGGAGAAVSYAMAQVGDAYVYGAAGPDAFDCSGLTMMAWAQAGVALPHSASAQYASGTHVAASDLRPGDLVFYYSPISHVGMYIGNGMIVNAENPSAGVKVTGLYTMPFAGAVRPG